MIPVPTQKSTGIKMDNVYTVREFRKHIKDALDVADSGDTAYLNRRGAVYEIRRVDISYNPVYTATVSSEPEVYTMYGCGCNKVSGQNVCKKHGRV